VHEGVLRIDEHHIDGVVQCLGQRDPPVTTPNDHHTDCHIRLLFPIRDRDMGMAELASILRLEKSSLSGLIRGTRRLGVGPGVAPIIFDNDTDASA